MASPPATPVPRKNPGADEPAPTLDDIEPRISLHVPQTTSIARKDEIWIRRKIAEGGMGTVWLAQSADVLGNWIALKRLRPEYRDNPKAQHRFTVEAEAVFSLVDHHIVRIYGVGSDTEGMFIKVGYVEGPDASKDPDWPPDLPNPPATLFQYVEQHGSLPALLAVEMFEGLCGGLIYAHDHDVIHRDIKPANVLINKQLEAIITDFSLARIGREDLLTHVGTRMGTPDYQAPEMERDAQSADERADIFGLGASLLFALTGKSPRRTENSDAPIEFRALLTKSMQTDRERRFATVREFEAALQQIRSMLEKDEKTDAVPTSVTVPMCILCRTPAGARGCNQVCAQCGASLGWTCAKARCGHRNAVWERYCANCALDSYAFWHSIHSIAQALREEISRVADQRQLFSASIFNKLHKVARCDHSKVAHESSWALTYLMEEYRPQLKAARIKRAEIVASADRLADEYRFLEAHKVLSDAIVPSLLNAAIRQKMSSFLDKASKRRMLKVEIKKANQRRDEPRALALVEEYHQLFPNEPDAAAMLAKLRQGRLHQIEMAFNDLRIDSPLEPHLEYLKQYPDSRHLAVVRRRAAELIREHLLKHPDDSTLRTFYLAWRTPRHEQLDLIQARFGNFLFGTVNGMLAGAILGVTLGAMTNFWGWFLIGIVGGAGASLAHEYSYALLFASIWSRIKTLWLRETEQAEQVSPNEEPRTGAKIQIKILNLIGVAMIGLAVFAGVVFIYWRYAYLWKAVTGCAFVAFMGAFSGGIAARQNKTARDKAAIGPMPLRAYRKQASELEEYARIADPQDLNHTNLQLLVCGIGVLLIIIFLLGLGLKPS